MAFPKIGLQAVLEMAGFDKGVKRYNQSLKGMTSETEEGATGMERSLSGVGAAISTAAIAAGAAVGAFFALKKAMELGREGAVILQTAQSFEFLMEKVGASADIMDELQEASGGTIDDMTLMKATTTLLAGAQGDLATAMANSAPQLLEIAKAANKLNPSLGDTAFLYESIATGVKRASPLILDNLGLVIKIGEANETYATKLGMTVEEMSAADKQMALLEATLIAGDVMIDQVGGSTEAATDEFDQLKAALKNVSDEAKTKLVPTLADVAGALLDVINLTLLWDKNLDGLKNVALDTTGSYRMYIGAVLDGAVAMKQLTQEEADAIKAHVAQGKALDELETDWDLQSTWLSNLTKKLELMTEAEWETIMAGRELDATYKDYGVRLLEVENAIVLTTEAQEEETESTEDQEKALKELERQLKAVQKRYEDYYTTLTKGILNIRDANKAIRDVRKDAAETIQGINADLGETVGEIQEKYDKMLPDPTTVADRLQMTEDAWDEHFLRMGALLDGVDTASENHWLEQTRQWVDGTDFMQREGESQVEWIERIRAAYYDNALPPEFYDTQTAQYKAFVEEKTRLGDEEIAEEERVAAEQKRIATEKANAAIAEAKRQRNETLVQTALQVAESLGLLQQWAADTQGALAPARDSAEEVMNELLAGTLTLEGPLGELVALISTGLLGSLEDTKPKAAEVEGAFATIFSTARTDAKGLLDDFGLLQTSMGDGSALMGGYFTQVTAQPEQTFFDFVLNSHGLLVEALQGGDLSTAVTEEGALMQTDLEAVGTQGVTQFARIKTAVGTVTTMLNVNLKLALKDTEKRSKELAEEMWKQFISSDHSALKAIERLTEAAEELLGVVLAAIAAIKRLNLMDIGGGGGGTGGGGGGGGGYQPRDPVIIPVGGPEIAPAFSAPALSASAAGIGAGVTVTFGDISINNGMDLAMFEARVENAVNRAVQGI